jgi:hypothetical protein
VRAFVFAAALLLVAGYGGYRLAGRAGSNTRTVVARRPAKTVTQTITVGPTTQPAPSDTVGTVVSPALPPSSVKFQLPGHEFLCVYDTERKFLRCDKTGGLTPPPNGSRFCPTVPGEGGAWDGMGIAADGRASKLCVSDAAGSLTSRIIAYGQSWRYGLDSCLSRRLGLTCVGASGHGFFLGYNSWEVF